MSANDSCVVTKPSLSARGLRDAWHERVVLAATPREPSPIGASGAGCARRAPQSFASTGFGNYAKEYQYNVLPCARKLAQGLRTFNSVAPCKRVAVFTHAADACNHVEKIAKYLK